MFRTPLRLRAAGRTDTGVHATGQVAHVDVPADAVPNAYPRSPDRLNRNSCRWFGGWAGCCPPTFESTRSSAPQRVSTRGFCAAPPLRLPAVDGGLRGGAAAGALRHRLAAPLDVAAMTAASRELVGLNDFAAFCRHREAPPRSAICSGWTGRATAI